MKTLNAVVLAAALFLTATAAAAHPAVLAPTPAPAGSTPAHVGALSESAAPEQGRRRRTARPERRREQPAEAAPVETPAPPRTAPPAQAPAPAPPGLCDVDWHQSNRGRGAVTRAIAGGADVNQACGSGSSPLLLALEVGRADVVLALIRAGANLEYRDPYTRLTANQVINDRCDAGELGPVCAEVRRGFEARAEAHNNLCDARWWRSFYRLSGAQATIRMLGVLRTPGLDVNYDCGRGDRPLHIALQDSLTPLMIGAAWAVWIFMNADNVNFGIRNRSGRSIMDLAEVRFDHQVRGNYRRLLSRYCNNQITGEEYNRQSNRNYKYELGAYRNIKQLSGEQAITVAINQEIFGTTQIPIGKDQLCLKYR